MAPSGGLLTRLLPGLESQAMSKYTTCDIKPCGRWGECPTAIAEKGQMGHRRKKWIFRVLPSVKP